MIDGDALARFGRKPSEQPKPASEVGGFDMDAYLSRHGFKVIRRKPWHSHPGGEVFELARCLFNEDHVDGSAAFTLVRGQPGFSCKHNGCQGKTIHDVFAAYPVKGAIPRVEVTDTWPDPMPLGGALPPVAGFNEKLLPIAFRAQAKDVAERMQVPIDYPAAASIVSLAGAVNRRAMIQPKARDCGWRIVPNLWGGIVGRPGFMKSPVIEAITRPIHAIQTVWFGEHETAVSDNKLATELHQLEINAWKQRGTQAFKRGATAPQRPTDPPQPPTCRRLIAGDATFEALHCVMSENPAGLLVLRDELTGWLAQLDKPGRECERAFCLEAWNGTSGFLVDRIERGTIYVPHVCMSLLGGIQPGRLRSYLSDALESGPADDGLIQRFQVLVWPDLPPDWSFVDREPDRGSEEGVLGIFHRLVKLPVDTPALFRFAADAQELFIEWYSELQAKVRAGNLHEALSAHLTKYASLMPSLALLFELADQGAVGEWSSQLVSLEHAQQSAATCEYLESHARRMYSNIISPQMRAAVDLAERIKRGEVGQEGIFAVRDIYRAGWSGLDNPSSAAAAVSILEDLGWVREIPAPDPGPRGGRRAASRYQVNPKVRGKK
jgi:putative DNA primase/helicase